MKMKSTMLAWAAVVAIGMTGGVAHADSYSDTIELFKNAHQSASFFKHSAGYAVFPSIGKAGLGVGGAFGKGRVYANRRLIGDVKMSQLSVGFQAGGQAYSQMIFFESKDALDEFTSGNFEFGANVGAIAITAAASGSAGTTGTTGSASAGKNDAANAGEYHDGMVVFTIAKGGLMYEASVSGQKFSYKRRGAK
jgi:lipid-binding SYLF domain-containing protein